jgi:hypothetical protein
MKQVTDKDVFFQAREHFRQSLENFHCPPSANSNLSIALALWTLAMDILDQEGLSVPEAQAWLEEGWRKAMAHGLPHMGEAKGSA